MHLERYDAQLAACADGYRDCGFPQCNIDLKLEHCRRVYTEADMIARDLVERGTIAEKEWRLACIAALFHDIGRFPQYARYGTFDDRKSENHGLLGCKTLKRGGALHGISRVDRQVIQTAVALHNRKSLPQGMPRIHALVTGIVRDADKLDIYPVMLAHLRPDAPANDVVTLGVDRDPKRYTTDIYDQVMAGTIGDYSLMRFTNDFKLLILSWIYDLNHALAKREVVRRGYVDMIFDMLPNNADFARLRKSVGTDLEAAGITI